MTRWKVQSAKHTGLEAREPISAIRQSSLPLREVFTPTRPQRGGASLIGRQAELRRMIELIQDEAAHVALYGDRGIGKTSLVNKLTGMLRAGGYCVGRYCCDSGTDYESMMLGLLRDLPDSFVLVSLSDSPGARGAEHALPQGGFGPGDIVDLPSRLDAQHIVLVIDEFDRVRNETARDRLADTIKQVSDRGVNLSFIIVGVSGDLEELIGRYPSVNRSIVGVHLPLLTEQETGQIIDYAAKASDYIFPPVIKAHIIALAAGSPYLTHLLGLRACLAARARDDREIIEDDLGYAIEQIANEMYPDFLPYYREYMSNAAAPGRNRQPASFPIPLFSE